MSKARVCIEKGAESVKQQACIKKSNKLVYQKPPSDPKCDNVRTVRRYPLTYAPPIMNPSVKRIKLCSGSDLKKLCPPPPVCPPPSPSLMERLTKFLFLGFKSLLAFAMIYATTDMGIWADNQTTRQLYDSVMCKVALMYADDIEPKAHRKTPAHCEEEMELFESGAAKTPCQKGTDAYQEQCKNDMNNRWNKMVYGAFQNMALIVLKFSGKEDPRVTDEMCKKHFDEEEEDDEDEDDEECEK